MDAEYIRIGDVSDFPPGALQRVVVSELSILVVNVNGKLYAVSNSCTHGEHRLATENWIMTS